MQAAELLGVDIDALAANTARPPLRSQSLRKARVLLGLRLKLTELNNLDLAGERCAACFGMKQVVGDAGRGDDCGDDPGTMCRCALRRGGRFKEWDCRLATIQSAALAEGGLFDLISASKPSQLPFFGVARQSVRLAPLQDRVGLRQRSARARRRWRW